jgi:hypothetical protein
MTHLPAKSRARGALLLAAFLVLSVSPRLLAGPSQQDVFKSIQDSMGSAKEVDSTPIYLLTAGGVVVLVILSLLSRRQQKADSSEALNHPRKLMKEVLREVPLKPAEMKQLKILAGAVEDQTGEDLNPLTLLLCPSLMARGLKDDRGKVDRKMVAQMVRRLRLSAANAKP